MSRPFLKKFLTAEFQVPYHKIQEKLIPFPKKNFTDGEAQKVGNVKRFLKIFLKNFSGSPIAQNPENVKTFFEIFFDYLETKRNALLLREMLDVSYHRTFVYPRTIKGTSLGELIRTRECCNVLYSELEVIDNFVNEIESACMGRSKAPLYMAVK